MIYFCQAASLEAEIKNKALKVGIIRDLGARYCDMSC